MLNSENVPADDIAEWGLMAKQYVFSAWGPAEGGAIHGAMFQTPSEKTILDINNYLDGLITRCSILPLEKSFRATGEKWRLYLDTCPYLEPGEKSE